MGGGEILKKGWLIKSPPLAGGGIKNWRKRWFVLLSSKVLEYYKSESGEQKGVINLEDCHSVNSNLFHKKYKCVFNIETKERVYFLVTKTEKEMKLWVDALCSVCELISEPDLPMSPEMASTLPSTTSKYKGPSISQPVQGSLYADHYQATDTQNTLYSLTAAAEMELYKRQNPNAHTLPVGISLSDNVSSKGLSSEDCGAGQDSSQVSAGGVDSGNVEASILSTSAFFTPRPGDNLGYVTPIADSQTMHSPPTHQQQSRGIHEPLTKSRSATLMPQLDGGNSGLGQRTLTNVMPPVNPHRFSRGSEMLANGFMMPQSNASPLESPISPPALQQPDTSSASLSPSRAQRSDASPVDESSFVHIPPPIDRSKKPPLIPVPPAIDRNLKPGRKTDESSDSSDSSPPKTDKFSTHEGYERQGLFDETEGKEEVAFSMTDIPCKTTHSTHYTQVEFDPDRRQPMPLPRVAAPTPTDRAAASVVPKPRRVNYTDVDIQATNRMAEQIHKQISVRQAERKALKERRYVNLDRMGSVDDETDPDYYTHMRSFNFEEADKPDYLTARMWKEQQQKYSSQEDPSLNSTEKFMDS